MLVPFLVIIPGMVAAVLVSEIHDLKLGTLTGTDAGLGDIKYNDAVLLLMRDVLPNGLLGLAITGLLASFMAGMAANISAFNTVFTVDLYQRYVNKDADDAPVPAHGAHRHRRGHDRRDLHGADRLDLLQPHGLSPAALLHVQRAPVRHLHHRHVLEARDEPRRLGGP